MKDPIIHQDFFERVYDVVRLIPYGRVTSYGAIARYLGSAQSSRMVGWAMNHSHKLKERIPAHRVVNRNGLLTGKAFFTETPMEILLQSEGIEVHDECICDFKTVFWDPSETLL